MFHATDIFTKTNRTNQNGKLFHPGMFDPASPQISRDSIIVIVVLSARVPGQTLLIKLDDSLRNASVGLLGWHKVCFITSLPLDEEHELSRRVSGSNNSLGIETSLKSSRPFVTYFLGLLGGGRVKRSCLALVVPWPPSPTLLLSHPLKLVNQISTIQVVPWLPSIILIAKATPFEQVLRLPIPSNSLVYHLLHSELFLHISHDDPTNKVEEPLL